MSQTVVLKVGMSCGGCVGAVKRVLSKMEGVDTFDIDPPPHRINPFIFSKNPIPFSNFFRIHSTMSQTVVLKVGMSCGGCVGAVKRVLSKMEGVDTFDIDLEQQKVTVKGNVQPDAVLQTVSKTGKKTEFWPAEGASATA